MTASWRAVVGGSSMTPTLLVGDWIYVEPGHDLRAGEVAAFRTAKEREVLCHRALLRLGWGPMRWYVHRGDAVGAGPGMVPVWKVLGRVTHVERNGRTQSLPSRVPPAAVRARALMSVLTHIGAHGIRKLLGSVPARKQHAL